MNFPSKLIYFGISYTLICKLIAICVYLSCIIAVQCVWSWPFLICNDDVLNLWFKKQLLSCLNHWKQSTEKQVGSLVLLSRSICNNIQNGMKMTIMSCKFTYVYINYCAFVCSIIILGVLFSIPGVSCSLTKKTPSKKFLKGN